MASQQLAGDNAIRKVAGDIDLVINSLMMAEKDPDTSYQAACLIQLCINQLNTNLITLNEHINPLLEDK